MYPNRTRPAWYRDAKWLCGILLALAIAAGTLLISLAQLTRPELGQRVLNTILSLTLLPETYQADPDEEPVLEEVETVVEGLDYIPGEPLTLIPGVDATISAADIKTVDAEEARNRIATLLADDIVAGGIPRATERLNDSTLNAQFSQAMQATLPPLVTSSLESALLDPPAELGTGTRLTDWRLQAQQNPTRNVQPIVGVFVTAPADVLTSLTSRQIGEYVVAELGASLLNEGLPAVQERVSREVVRTLITQTAQDEIRTQAAELFNALLVPQDALITERLADANATVAAQAAPVAAAATLTGLTPASALEGLTPAEANRRIISDIASAVYASEASAVASQLSDPAQAAQLSGVAGLVNLLSAQQHQKFVRWTYFAGGVALVLIIIFMYFCVSWERFVGSGFSIMAGAALGSLVFTTFARTFPSGSSPLPAAPPASGIPSYAGETLLYTVRQLPPNVTELFVRNHLIVLATGAGLIGLFLIQQVWNVIRPNRRRYM